MELVSVDEAATRLGVSVRQVQRLARDGLLKAVGPNRFEWESVIRLHMVRQGQHRRVWTEATAWAAIAKLADIEVEETWLGQAQRSRLKSALRAQSAPEVVERTRNRATVHRLAAHRSAVTRIASEIVVSGSSRSVAGLTAAVDSIDGYIDPDGYATLVSKFRLSAESEGGNVTLRVTGFDLTAVAAIAAAGDVLAGLDLAESLDARERAAGLAVLDDALRRLR